MKLVWSVFCELVHGYAKQQIDNPHSARLVSQHWLHLMANKNLLKKLSRPVFERLHCCHMCHHVFHQEA